MGGDYREAVQQRALNVPNQAAYPNQSVEVQEPIPKAWLDQISTSIGGYWVVFSIFLVGLLSVTILRRPFLKAVKKKARQWVLDEASSGDVKIKNE